MNHEKMSSSLSYLSSFYRDFAILLPLKGPLLCKNNGKIAEMSTNHDNSLVTVVITNSNVFIYIKKTLITEGHCHRLTALTLVCDVKMSVTAL